MAKRKEKKGGALPTHIPRDVEGQCQFISDVFWSITPEDIEAFERKRKRREEEASVDTHSLE